VGGWKIKFKETEAGARKKRKSLLKKERGRQKKKGNGNNKKGERLTGKNNVQKRVAFKP